MESSEKTPANSVSNRPLQEPTAERDSHDVSGKGDYPYSIREAASKIKNRGFYKKSVPAGV